MRGSTGARHVTFVRPFSLPVTRPAVFARLAGRPILVDVPHADRRALRRTLIQSACPQRGDRRHADPRSAGNRRDRLPRARRTAMAGCVAECGDDSHGHGPGEPCLYSSGEGLCDWVRPVQRGVLPDDGRGVAGAGPSSLPASLSPRPQRAGSAVGASSTATGRFFTDAGVSCRRIRSISWPYSPLK